MRSERDENDPANAVQHAGSSSAFGFPRGWWANNEEEESMNRGLILIVTLIVLAAAQAQKQAAQSAMFIEHRITAPTAEFTASTDKTYIRSVDGQRGECDAQGHAHRATDRRS